MSKPILIYYGLGADSTEIIRRLYLEPENNPDWFKPEDAIVVSAMVGLEHRSTKRLVENYMYPLLSNQKTRTVQVARTGYGTEYPIKILDDSRNPTICHSDGQGYYTLMDELLSSGVVPRVAGGKHICALHAKVELLKRWEIQEFGKNPDVIRVIGYNYDEIGRRDKSNEYVKENRREDDRSTTVYPLIDHWKVDRAGTEAGSSKLAKGEPWYRSACYVCPFAATSGGIKITLQRFREEPDAAAAAMFAEAISTAMNPTQNLYGTNRSVREAIRKDGNLEAIALYENRLNSEPWAVYRVRRYRPENFGIPMGREITRLHIGSKVEITERIKQIAFVHELAIEDNHSNLRVWVQKREETLAAVFCEEFYVACPAVVQNKKARNFDREWNDYQEKIQAAKTAEAKFRSIFAA